MKKICFWMWAMLLTVLLTATIAIPAYSQDRDDRDQRMDQNRDQHVNRDYDRNQGRWENRDQWDYRAYGRGERPEGWSQGERTESRNCGVTYECYTYNYQGAPYYYYRDNNGRMIVRRRHHDNDRDDYRRDRDDRRNHEQR